MTHFSAWAFAWAICLILASALAWAITSAPERPSTPAAPVPMELVGQRRASWDLPEVRKPNSLPLCSGIRQPIPAHVLARTIMPAWEPVREPVITHTRQAADRAAIEREQRTRELPRPATYRVVPLWVACWEEQQQAERRRALEAASAGLPDPGYTYPGAHSLRVPA
jgi:hypothetical protein